MVKGTMIAWCAVVTVVGAGGRSPARGEESPARVRAAGLVERVRQADYRDDRDALSRLHEELAPLAGDEGMAARIEYWRGFALWRRAVNGFNDGVDSTEQSADLSRAVDDFAASLAADSTFVDAKIGALGAQGLLLYLNQGNPTRLQELAPRATGWLKELRAEAADNPRFLWVLGPMLWSAPPERGGGEEKAMAGYRRGLEILRGGEPAGDDPLEPTWGEPELLMNLAWSNLHKADPDLDAAERFAKEALAIVPDWHYTRDILLVQILDAKETGQ